MHVTSLDDCNQNEITPNWCKTELFDSIVYYKLVVYTVRKAANDKINEVHEQAIIFQS